MTTTTITTLSDNEMREDLSRYVERQTRRTKGIIKGSMENLAEDFNENFMWDPEKIYKGNRRLEFLNEISQLLNDDGCNIEGMRFYLRHAAEHAADDIMHRDPYRHSTNAVANLANQWDFESYKEILEKPGRRDPRGRGRLTTGAEIRQTPNKQNKNDPCRNSCRQGIFM